MKDEYTITQSVRDVCAQMKEGEELLGYQLCNRVLDRLWEAGSNRRPLDSSILRLVRKVGSLYGVKAVAEGVSRYRKEER